MEPLRIHSSPKKTFKKWRHQHISWKGASFGDLEKANKFLG